MPLKVDEQYAVLRRNLSRGLTEASTSVQHAAKFVGGVTILRDRAGSGRTPLDPMARGEAAGGAEDARDRGLLGRQLPLSAGLPRRASISSFDIANSSEVGVAVPTPDIAIDQQVLALQRVALNQLMSDTVAQRLLNNESKSTDPKDALRLAELYETLHAAIWSELKSGRDIPLFRRNLQREHATRLASALLATVGVDAHRRAGAAARRCEAAARRARGGADAERTIRRKRGRTSPRRWRCSTKR